MGPITVTLYANINSQKKARARRAFQSLSVSRSQRRHSIAPEVRIAHVLDELLDIAGRLLG